VPPHYGTRLAKLIVHGPARASAVGGLRRALDRCEIGGVATNLPLHSGLASDPAFAAGGGGTDFLDLFLGRAMTGTGTGSAGSPPPPGMETARGGHPAAGHLVPGREPEPVGSHRADHPPAAADRPPHGP